MSVENDIQYYQGVDQQLDEIASDTNLISAFDPKNVDVERQRFLDARSAGNQYDPQFEYSDLNVDVDNKLDSISGIEIDGEGPLAKVLQETRKSVELTLRMLQNRGNVPAMKELNEQLYGAPSSDLVNQADQILKGNDPLAIELKAQAKEKSKEGVDYKKLSEDAVLDALKSYGLSDTWGVEWKKVASSKTDVDTRRVVLNEGGKFGPNAPLKLARHEVDVHVLRAVNGANQPLSLFERGFPGYVATEEGLAVYTEKMNGVLSLVNLRNYAARVIAVDSMMNQHTFNQCVDRLVAYNFSLEGAFNVTLRAYRGGGFAKDQEYLKGFRMVEDYVEKGGDLKDLYYGRFGLEHLDLVKQMAEQGILTPKDSLLLPHSLRIEQEGGDFLVEKENPGV